MMITEQSVGQDAGWNCPLVNLVPSHGCVVVVVAEDPPEEEDVHSTQMTNAMNAVKEDTMPMTVPKTAVVMEDHDAEAGIYKILHTIYVESGF